MIKEIKEPLAILLVIFILLGFGWDSLEQKGNEERDSGRISVLSDSSEKEIFVSEQNIAEEIKDIEEEVADLGKEVKEAVAENKRSPYYNKIKLSSFSGVRRNDPSREYARLTVGLDNGETVKITGWYLKSEITGRSATIGQAALLPFPFTRTESDIILKSGDRVYLIKGFSPIGVSFRLNKCTGYFEQNRSFVPSLPQQCPRPRDEELPYFSKYEEGHDVCVEVIESLPRCIAPDGKFLHDLQDTVIRECRTYIKEQINYNACVSKHIGDTDFPSNEYRVYLNKFGPLWRAEREKINLHDKSGLIVATIEY